MCGGGELEEFCDGEVLYCVELKLMQCKSKINHILTIFTGVIYSKISLKISTTHSSKIIAARRPSNTFFTFTQWMDLLKNWFSFFHWKLLHLESQDISHASRKL